MKVFIVFLGLLVLNVSYLSYQGDMEKFVREQAFLKFTAEECAAGAALMLNEDEYGQGEVVFDYVEARLYAENHLRYVAENSKLEGVLNCELIFQDDQTGYDNGQDSVPSVTATVTLETKDIFRMPLISVTEISRSSRYEWKE